MYFSLADEATDERAVQDILATAQHHNALHEVTGFLSYNGTEFLQFLEGPEEALRRLMYNIEADRRHHAVFWLTTGFADARIFTNWNMQHLSAALCRATPPEGIQDTITVEGITSRLSDRFRAAYTNYLAGGPNNSSAKPPAA